MQKSQRRSTKVCTRCRQRKTKCDFKFPQCTSCSLANAACLGYDPATKQAVPRSLVKSLEARVAYLEAQLRALQSISHNLPYSMASKIAQANISFGVPQPGPYLQSKLSSALFLRPSCPPLAISPTVRLSEAESSEPNELSSQQRRRSRHKSPYKPNMINLGSVPHSAMERMIRNYSDTHLPQYPIISATMLEHALQQFRPDAVGEGSSLFDADPTFTGLGHFEFFVIFIILAISASTLTWRAETQAREACDSFYKSALKHLQLLEDYSEIKQLQISLLLAHFAHMCPELVDNWTCISNAVRIALSLGLYRECPEGLDAEQRRLRSELFWVTYGMERSLCTNLRLPLSFPEEAITTKVRTPEGLINPLFSADDVKKKSSANHIYRYRMMETEVHRALYLQEEVLMLGFPSVEEWIQDVTARLDVWYTEAQTYTPYNMLEFKHVQFHHLQVRIYRPTPRLRTKLPQDWEIVLKACRSLIDDYVGQERRRRLFYPWHGVHILFETASVALDASWSARDYPPLIGEAEDMLQTHIPRCLQLLSTIGERWNEATECGNHLRPILEKVHSAFSAPDRSAHDLAIAEEINGLLFPDKLPVWSMTDFGMDDFGFEGGSLLLDNMSVDDMEFLQWGEDWDIMPPEFIPETEIL
ncbi:Zn(II)2Cys6 transcription factor [Aspergillus lucknowensis]|uniref:Zn(2)-C6 fungal-type domain-containing protein n=1 Tax=Aspergillus lucknowensis TaxID=176173 RepID=A0ABR4LHM3_9EURO